MIQLLLIRHALAQDKTAFAKSGLPDAVRPLTKDGRGKMMKVVRGLVPEMPVLRTLVSSPLRRTQQTAQIIVKGYPKLKIRTCPHLAPGAPPSGLTRWLNRQNFKSPIALVGHEPDLGRLLAWFLVREGKSFVDFKKGGACLVEFEDDIVPGKGRLLWLLTPRHLRRLG